VQQVQRSSLLAQYSQGERGRCNRRAVIDDACQPATTLLSSALLHGACKTCYQSASLRHVHGRNEDNLIYAACLFHLPTSSSVVPSSSLLPPRRRRAKTAVCRSCHLLIWRATANGLMCLCPLDWVRVAFRYAHSPSIK
jgi:hypothetical protein